MIMTREAAEQQRQHREAQTKLKRDEKDIPVIDRIADMLFEIYYTWFENKDARISISQLHHKHKLGPDMGPALQLAGVLSKTGTSVNTVWKWERNAEPTYETACEVFDAMQTYRTGIYSKKNAKRSVASRQEKEAQNLNARNMVKIDRKQLAADHVVGDVADKLVNIFGLLRSLHVLLANKDWVLGRSIDLAFVPLEFGLHNSILRHVFATTLESRGTNSAFEVRLRSDAAPTLVDAAGVFKLERDYVRSISVEDNADDLDLSEAAITDTQIDSAVAELTQPVFSQEFQDTITPMIQNAIDSAVHDDTAEGTTTQEDPQRGVIIALAKRFAKLKEYETALELLNLLEA